MPIEIDESTLSSDLGAAKPVVVPATRYRQGGRLMYHITTALAQLPQIVIKRPDPDHPIEGNRKVVASRARNFGTYVTSNEDWVSPAIIVRAPAGEIEFFEAKTFDDGTAWGELTIPLPVLSEILLLDGQHRTLGIFQAIEDLNSAIRKKRDQIAIANENGNEDTVPELQASLDDLLQTRDRFTKDHMSVDIAVVTTAKAKQMFADIANNAKGVNPDYTTILDQRQAVNRIAAELIDDHPLLKDRVELGQSTRMSKTNPNLIGAKTVADIVRAVHVGVSGRIGARTEDELSANQVEAVERVAKFLDVLLSSFEDLQAIADEGLEPLDLREEDSENRSMVASATMLRVLAGVYHDLSKKPSDEDGPEALSRSEIEAFFRALAPKMREVPIAEDDDFWLPTGSFLPDTAAPQARAGTMSGLVRAMVGWAREETLVQAAA